MQHLLKSCRLCPIECGADRLTGCGRCGAGRQVKAAKAFLHQWEEPCISGEKGSGTVFFTGCNMKCVFCQNYELSHGLKGKEITADRLAQIFLELQSQGAHNINLVSPTPYAPQIAAAVRLAKAGGLVLPVIYNTNGYEKVETLRLLKGIVDIYLPDIKYYSDETALELSSAPSYFSHATMAVAAMLEQVGHPVFDRDGMLVRGVIVRHLILPGRLEESKRILDWVRQHMGAGAFVSLMCQYTPMYRAAEFTGMDRRLTQEEYDEIIDYFFEIGLENGFAQELDSATSDYTPDFDFSGI